MRARPSPIRRCRRGEDSFRDTQAASACPKKFELPKTKRWRRSLEGYRREEGSGRLRVTGQKV